MQTLWHDLRYTLRQLRNAPVFALTAVLTLALGLGATIAIFSIVNGVLLRPLPFADPDQLVLLGDHLEGTDWGEKRPAPVTAPEIGTYARETRAFQNMGGYGEATYELSGNGTPEQVHATRMGAALFPTLGVAPLLGRTFTPDEDEKHELVTVLSYATWKNRFQGNPHILGTKVLLDRQPYLVIGVMPKSFEFPLVPGHLNRSELWVPLSPTQDELVQGASSWGFHLIARLKKGITTPQATDDAERVAHEIMRGYRADMAGLHIRAVVSPLRAVTVEQARPLLRALFLAVLVVLLIVCANLAGLLLVRALRRQREIAVRLALGASSGALLRYLMFEGLVLSLCGGLLGVVFASMALHVGKSLLPESLPRISDIDLNWSGIVLALLLAMATGLLCGLAPAFATLRTDVNVYLKDAGRSNSASGGPGRLRSMLVIGEIAIAMILLTTSGLLLRSFEQMSTVDLGFQPEHVVTAGYTLPQKQYATQAAVNGFNNELLTRLRQAPGSQAAGITTGLPASGVRMQGGFVPDGYVSPKGAGVDVATPLQVTGEYFRAAGIPLLQGRFFNTGDRPDTQLVAIVNHKLAEHYWPKQNPIGKRIRIGTQEMKTPWMTIVGEIADVKLGSPDLDATEQYYNPIEQTQAALGSLASPENLIGNGGYLVLRSALAPEQMENILRATVRSLDPQLALTQVQTLEQVVEDSEASRRFNTSLITLFAAVALLLAMLGVYSVTAFSVASQERELAIRIALGSERASVARLVLVSGAKLAVAGSLLGLTGAAMASGLLRSLLFKVSPFDPLVLAAAPAIVLILSLGACMLPALRAAFVNPMEALRTE